MNGNYCYLFFAGYYATEQAADVLQRYGIPARVVKSPVMLQSGCSFAVLVESVSADRAAKVLAQNHITVLQIITREY